MRARLLLILLVLLLAIPKGVVLRAQQSGTSSPNQAEDEKKRQFLKAREEMRTLPPSTPASATPGPKPKPRATSTPEATPKPHITSAPPPTTPKPTPEPRPHEREKETPKPEPATPKPAPPRVTPPPITPTPQPASPVTPAPVTVEKSGYEESHGLQPATGFSWFTRWKYLSKSVRAEIDKAPVQQHRWRYIVVHNSGTRQGNARAFDYYHLHVRHMVNGLAYHFVIGNGSSSGDGEVEIGNRWKRQINGGHVHSDYLNNIALGICLVGDFNHDTPTGHQLAALDELIRYLRQRVGKIDRQWAIVKAHREINPPRWPTDCPGDHFPYQWLHRQFDQ